MRKLFALLILVFGSTGVAGAETRSVVSVPISIEIAALEAYANSQIPTPLYSRRADHRCDLGLFDVGCTIDERVSPVGLLELDGDGSNLVARLVIDGRATLSGRGDLGSQIQKTAHGRALFNVTMQPTINPDWTLALPMSVNFQWQQRPTAMLFNAIPVTFGTVAEEALRAEIADFQSNTLPGALERVDLRGRIEQLWLELQAPNQLDLPGGTRLWLHFVPEEIGVAPLSIDATHLSTVVFIAGQTWVSVALQQPEPIIALPDQTPVPSPGFDVTVPVNLPLQAIEREIAAALPETIPFETDEITGEITVRALRLGAEGDRLNVELDARLDLHGWPDFDGALRLSGVPGWNEAEQQLRLADVEVSTEGGGLTASFLRSVGLVSIVTRLLEDALERPLNVQFEAIEREVLAAFDGWLPEAVDTQADLRLSVSDLRLSSDHLDVIFHAIGDVSVTGVTLQ